MTNSALKPPTSRPWGMVSLVWKTLLAATMVIMIVAVGLGIGSRYILNAPFFWTEEVSRFGLVWMTFLGSAELFRRRLGHIAVTALLDVIPRWISIPLRVIGAALVIAILAVMVVGGVAFADPQRPAVSAALGIPMWIVYLAVPLSGALGLVFFIQGLFRSISRSRKS